MSTEQPQQYIDGFVIPIAKDKVEEYRKMASQAAKIWMKHGALQYIESVGEDLDPKMGDSGMTIVTFPKLANAKENETIIFAFIVYKSRAHRDEVNAKVMADPAMSPENFKEEEMPFDCNNMTYGGFQTIVNHMTK